MKMANIADLEEKLRCLVLPDVEEEAGGELGRGSYGVVVRVKVKGLR